MFLLLFFIIFLLFIFNNLIYKKLNFYIIESYSNKLDIEKITKELEKNINLSTLFKNNYKKNEICFSKDYNKENISTMFKYLSNQIDSLIIDNEIMKKKVDKLYDNYNEDINYSNERNQKAKEIKEAFTKNLSKSTSILSGISSKKSNNLLQKHYNEKLTKSNAKEYLSKQSPMSIDTIFKRNIKISKSLDKFVKDKPKDIIHNLKNNYLASNKIKCKCSQTIPPNINLGDILIQLSNNEGFNKKNKCGNDKECLKQSNNISRKKSKKYLYQLSKIFNCSVTNRNGLFPNEIKDFK